jgi:hypothetical protein
MMRRIGVILPGLIALAVLVALVAGLWAWLFLPAAYAEQRARALIPPIYPGAELGMLSQVNSAGLATEERAYLAQADVLAVTSWLERAMPGFVPCPGTTKAECWMNERCDESLEGLMALRLNRAEGPTPRPCVSVMAQSEVPFGNRTVIRMSIGWPIDL